MIDPATISEAGLSTHENNLPLFLTYLKSSLPNTEVHFLGIQIKTMEMTDEMTLSKDVHTGALALIGMIASSRT